MVHHHLIEEVEWFQGQQGWIRLVNHQMVHSQFLQELGLPLRPDKSGWNLIGAKELSRMRIEREDNGWSVHTVSVGDEPFNNPSMTSMNSVKIPNRQRASAPRAIPFLETANQLHGTKPMVVRDVWMTS